MKVMGVLIGVALATGPAISQTLAGPTQVIVGPAPMVVGQTQATMLLTGTAVPLRMVSNLTTKGSRLKVGDRFDLEVAEAITLNGVTVIPVGSRAVGEVTFLRNKGMLGQSGLIETRLLYVRANNRQIRITGKVEDKGKANGGAAWASGAFFITGTSAVIPPGTPVLAYLDEDMPVAFAPGVASSAPMIVQVPLK